MICHVYSPQTTSKNIDKMNQIENQILNLTKLSSSFARSHLREIRDRSVLRLFESNEVAAPQVLPGGAGVPQPLPSNGTHWEPATDNVSHLQTLSKRKKTS